MAKKRNPYDLSWRGPPTELKTKYKVIRYSNDPYDAGGHRIVRTTEDATQIDQRG